MADSATLLTRMLSNNGSHDMFISSGQNTPGWVLSVSVASRFENGSNII